jgi:hypothetical protein
MTRLNDYNGRPDGAAEELLAEVFAGRMADADPQIARLRLERKLKSASVAGYGAVGHHPRPTLRYGLLSMLAATALVVFGGWATNISVKPWDDAQQVTLPLAAGWTPSDYPRLVGELGHYSDALHDAGVTSLIVDYKRDADGYCLQLGLLGADYSTANEWVRTVLSEVPEVTGGGYSITQPMVPYAISVGDMLAFSLTGHSAAVQRNVVSAWQRRVTANGGGRTSNNAMVFLITRDKDYARRVGMVEY